MIPNSSSSENIFRMRFPAFLSPKSNHGSSSSSNSNNKPSATEPSVASSSSSNRQDDGTPAASDDSSSPPGEPPQRSYRVGRFVTLLDSENVDMNELRKLSWNGVPVQFRTMVWQLHLGYLPTNRARREQAIVRKRKEYLDSIPMYFDVSEYDRTTQEGETLRQIRVDLPRTNPDTPFFQQAEIQGAMERILYIWSIRHPASGYVQGMNDLLTPLLLVSMLPYALEGGRCSTLSVFRCDVATLDRHVLKEVRHFLPRYNTHPFLHSQMKDMNSYYTILLPTFNGTTSSDPFVSAIPCFPLLTFPPPLSLVCR